MAVPWPRQLSLPAAGVARIPWPELTGAAEQLESGSHTGGDLKLTSPNEVTALESTNHLRQLDRARGTTTPLSEGVPPPAPGTVLLSPRWWVSSSKFPWAPGCGSGWSRGYFVSPGWSQLWCSPASSNSGHWAYPCPGWGRDGGAMLVPWEVATGLCGSTRAWGTPATSDTVTSCFI